MAILCELLQFIKVPIGAQTIYPDKSGYSTAVLLSTVPIHSLTRKFVKLNFSRGIAASPIALQLSLRPITSSLNNKYFANVRYVRHSTGPCLVRARRWPIKKYL